jgi:hypothetical protein
MAERVEREDDLPDEDYQVREVYAYAGLALYFAQVLEHGLVNVLTIAEHAADPNATRSDVDAAFERHFAATFGKLRRLLEPYVVGDASLIADLGDALAARNRLAHSFFRDHALDFMNENGRDLMLQELKGMADLFRAVDARLTPVLFRHGEARGLSPEAVHQRFDELLHEAGPE